MTPFGPYPSASARHAAIVHHAYRVYVDNLAAHGRVPASLEVILAEARAHSTLSILELLVWKRATLLP